MYVVNKFKGKLEKEDLKRFAKEVGTLNVFTITCNQLTVRNSSAPKKLSIQISRTTGSQILPNYHQNKRRM